MPVRVRPPSVRLRPAERRVITDAAAGKITDFAQGLSVDTLSLVDAEPERTVRADILRALLLDELPGHTIHARGLQVRGARIDGELDFTAAKIAHRLTLTSCKITKILLTDAEIQQVNLSGSRVERVDAAGVHVRGSLLLTQGFSVESGVDLAGAEINGNLQCSAGSFRGARVGTLLGDSVEGPALEASRIKVHGSVILSSALSVDQFLPFHATGTVDLRNASIGGDLDCSGGKFEHPEVALIVNGAKVQGSVRLSISHHLDTWIVWRFSSLGVVELIGTEIGADLECSGGEFSSRTVALNAGQAKVHGIVRLSAVVLEAHNSVARFEAAGSVKLVRIQIDGDLDCDGAELKNRDCALLVDGATVQGSAHFSRLTGDTRHLKAYFKAMGPVYLRGANIQGDLLCAKGLFLGEEAALSASGLQVANILHWRPANTPIGTINLERATVGVVDDDKDRWPPSGKLNIRDFRYEGFSRGLDAWSDRKEWLLRQAPFTPQPYTQLAYVYRTCGHDAEARRAEIERERQRRKSGGMGLLGRIRSHILAATMLYGYVPALTLVWLIGLYAIGVLMFHSAGKGGAMVPTRSAAPSVGVVAPGSQTPHYSGATSAPGQVTQSTQSSASPTSASTGSSPRSTASPKSSVGGANVPSQSGQAARPMPQNCTHDYPCFSPWIFAVDVAVPLLNLRQAEFWQPDARGRWGQACRIYMWFSIPLGWILVTLAVSGFTGLVRRI
jgi:hypothetical protein